MCVVSSNDKETFTLDNQMLWKEDLLLRCFVPSRVWKVG